MDEHNHTQDLNVDNAKTTDVFTSAIIMLSILAAALMLGGATTVKLFAVWHPEVVATLTLKGLFFPAVVGIVVAALVAFFLLSAWNYLLNKYE